VLDSQGKYEEAEDMLHLTLELREKVLDSNHPDTLTSMDYLAWVLRSQGKYEAAPDGLLQVLSLACPPISV
jgi:hypothetical protein